MARVVGGAAAEALLARARARRRRHVRAPRLRLEARSVVPLLARITEDPTLRTNAKHTAKHTEEKENDDATETRVASRERRRRRRRRRAPLGARAGFTRPR